MEIKLVQTPVEDVFKGYQDFGEDEGVVGYHGQLDIRPKYQRNFVYDIDQEKAVINTVLHGYPLNVMYWAVNGPDKFEILDGQQRTLSIMHFLDHKFSIKWDNSTYYFDSLPDDLREKILNYKLMVYRCDGDTSEKLAWFRTVNIAGVALSDQELRNIAYTGPWLSDAKRHFSKRGCAAKGLAGQYVKGDPNRQELLEKALAWIGQAQGVSIEEYMAKHRSDDDADELWQYWQDIFDWVEKIFPTYHKQMKGLDWGCFFNTYRDNKYNSRKLNDDIERLLDDPEVTKARGIWQYELAKDYEPNAVKYLSLRTFNKRDIERKYKEQTDKAKDENTSNCPYCSQEGLDTIWPLDKMDADHITPWSKGGVTEYENLQMLCQKHNRSKGNH